MPIVRSNSRRSAYAAIDSERAYQDDKWPNSLDKTIDEFALYICEYAAQLRHVASTTDDVTARLDAVRKVGGLAVACMEAHGAPLRGDDPEAEAGMDSILVDCIHKAAEGRTSVIVVCSNPRQVQATIAEAADTASRLGYVFQYRKAERQLDLGKTVSFRELREYDDCRGRTAEVVFTRYAQGLATSAERLGWSLLATPEHRFIVDDLQAAMRLVREGKDVVVVTAADQHKNSTHQAAVDMLDVGDIPILETQGGRLLVAGPDDHVFFCYTKTVVVLNLYNLTDEQVRGWNRVHGD